jgi:hypothetical protein
MSGSRPKERQGRTPSDSSHLDNGQIEPPSAQVAKGPEIRTDRRHPSAYAEPGRLRTRSERDCPGAEPPRQVTWADMLSFDQSTMNKHLALLSARPVDHLALPHSSLTASSS